jgi:hypothetical protein
MTVPVGLWSARMMGGWSTGARASTAGSPGSSVASVVGEDEPDRSLDRPAGGALDQVADRRPTGLYRLHDLDGRGRLVAAMFVIALLVAPLSALVRMAPDWAPATIRR